MADLAAMMAGFNNQEAKPSGANEICEVFLKFLPWNTNKEKVTKFFEKIKPTNVKVAMNHDGTCKGYGFLTFATQAEAERCAKKWDKRAMGEKGTKMRHISVTLAKPKTNNVAIKRANKNVKAAQPPPKKPRIDEKARVESLTRDIAFFASRKQLHSAIIAFETIKKENLTPTVYTYSNMLNAYINSGEMEKAENIFDDMLERGGDCAPNVIVFTTLMKGYERAGEVEKCMAMLQEMLAQKPPVYPDSRTINTFLRACLRVGDLPAAQDMWKKLPEWEVVPSHSSYKTYGRLLAQGLLVDELKQLIKTMPRTTAGNNLHDAGPCMFWNKGHCDRGVNCKFYHDPNIIQKEHNQLKFEDAQRDLSMNLNLAHAAALVGNVKTAKKALKKVEEARQICEATQVTTRTFDETQSKEFKLEADRIQKFLDENNHEESQLGASLRRTLVFSSKLTNEEEENQPAETPQTLRSTLLETLQRTFGINGCIDAGLATFDAFKKRISKIISKEDGRINFNKIFKEELPIKLEICSGNGDWVVAQANAEKNKANWGALELRHDRVYAIFSRMLFQNAKNLSVIGGDAHDVLSKRIRDQQINWICINFPEPPHNSGNDEAESKFHLLTGEFFTQCNRVLQKNGGITIFSDNEPYLHTLAKTIGALKKDEMKMFKTVKVDDNDQFETFEGIRVYKGLPNEKCGHAVYAASYFDRFWEQGQRTDRFFLSVKKYTQNKK